MMKNPTMSRPTPRQPAAPTTAAATPAADAAALPNPDLDLGIITSGLCATPADQERFDRDQAGRPPLEEAQQSSLEQQNAELRSQVAQLGDVVAQLRTELHRRDVVAVVDAAIAAHHLLPVQREWAMKLGLADLDRLRAFCGGSGQ